MMFLFVQELITRIAQPRHNLSQAHHKPQIRYGEVCAIKRDLCVFGILLVFFSEVVIRERKMSNMSVPLAKHGANI